MTYTNLASGQHTAQFRATDSTALQGPSVSFTWQITTPTSPPDSSCISSSRTGRIIMGTSGDDTLIGSSGNDIINDRDGNDGTNGCNGADVISGGNGDDRIAGSQGNDILQGDAGNDLIQGDFGNDQIFGGNGNDIPTGGPGKDHFNCGEGTDTITDFQPVLIQRLQTVKIVNAFISDPEKYIGDSAFYYCCTTRQIINFILSSRFDV